jgi:hypothetical protein
MIKAMTTIATAMLAAIRKVRRPSYQPISLKMPRKNSPNPCSKPSPRAVLIKESRKNTADQSGPDQCVGALQAVRLGPSTSNSRPQAEYAGDRQGCDTKNTVRHRTIGGPSRTFQTKSPGF